MPTATPPLQPKPSADVPFIIDGNKINPDWDKYLTALDKLVRQLRGEIP